MQDMISSMMECSAQSLSNPKKIIFEVGRIEKYASCAYVRYKQAVHQILVWGGSAVLVVLSVTRLFDSTAVGGSQVSYSLPVLLVLQTIALCAWFFLAVKTNYSDAYHQHALEAEAFLRRWFDLEDLIALPLFRNLKVAHSRYGHPLTRTKTLSILGNLLAGGIYVGIVTFPLWDFGIHGTTVSIDLKLIIMVVFFLAGFGVVDTMAKKARAKTREEIQAMWEAQHKAMEKAVEQDRAWQSRFPMVVVDAALSENRIG